MCLVSPSLLPPSAYPVYRYRRLAGTERLLLFKYSEHPTVLSVDWGGVDEAE